MSLHDKIEIVAYVHSADLDQPKHFPCLSKSLLYVLEMDGPKLSRGCTVDIRLPFALTLLFWLLHQVAKMSNTSNLRV